VLPVIQAIFSRALALLCFASRSLGFRANALLYETIASWYLRKSKRDVPLLVNALTLFGSIANTLSK